MASYDPRNMAISFAGNVVPGYGDSEIADGGPEPMPLQIVFKRTSRKARQKFLAAKARELETTIRGVKKLYGNGSSLTVPGCRITRNSGGLLEFAGDGMVVSFALREAHIPELGKV